MVCILRGITETFVPPTNNCRIWLFPCRANIYAQKPKKEHRLYLSSCACGQSIKFMLHRVLITTAEAAWDTTCFNKCWFSTWCVSPRSAHSHYYIHQKKWMALRTLCRINLSPQYKAVKLNATVLNMLDTPRLYVCKLLRTNIWQCNKHACSIYWPASTE